MLYIAVCDDNAHDRDMLVSYIHNVVAENGLEVEISTFNNGISLLKEAQGKHFSICFLDIVMDEMNGVETARGLSLMDPSVNLVFITTSQDYMAEGYEIGVINYMLKPFQQKQVEISLYRCLRMSENDNNYIELTVNRESRRIRFSEILNIEAQNKICIIRLTEGELRSYITLKEIEKLLNDRRFLRCQRSFLVNMDQVSGIKGSEFMMKDNSTVPIRRDGRSEIRKEYEAYLFEKVRRRF